MKKMKVSPHACLARNLPWKIKAKSEQKDKDELALGFYLGCNTKSKSTNCSVRAVAELRLVHQTDPKKSLIKKTDHLFCFKEYSWGYFITMKEILDPKKGLFCRSSSSLTLIICQKF